MPNIQCLSFPLADANAAQSATMMRGSDAKAESVFLQTVEELTELLRTTRQSRSVARFHDEDFHPLMSLWKWEGTAAGLAFIMKHGQLRQANLMLSGLDEDGEKLAIQNAANIFSGLTEGDRCSIHKGSRPMLVTFGASAAAAAEEDDGAYLLGMIIMSAFCEACGLP